MRAVIPRSAMSSPKGRPAIMQLGLQSSIPRLLPQFR